MHHCRNMHEIHWLIYIFYATWRGKFHSDQRGRCKFFLEIEITQNEYYCFELSQPFLINRILSFLGLCNIEYQTDANKSATPVAKGILHRYFASKPRKLSWKYRTDVGMLSYLQGNTRPDISMAVHQTARFCKYPRLSHEKAIMRLGRYLLDTLTRGIVYKPYKSKGLECYVDSDLAGGWTQSDSDNNENFMSWTGYVIA